MAIIATMTKHEDGSFTGVLTTLNVKANIRIAPVSKTSEDAPDYRVSAGANAEIGAGWTSMSKKNQEYVSCKLDDPSFPAPISCALVETPEGHVLVWSRKTEN
jgi:uncharacterized protein (DUF736 family)